MISSIPSTIFDFKMRQCGATQPWGWCTVVFRGAKAILVEFTWHLWVSINCRTKRKTRKDTSIHKNSLVILHRISFVCDADGIIPVYRTDSLHNDSVFTASPTSGKHTHVQSGICTRQICPTDRDTILARVKKTLSGKSWHLADIHGISTTTTSRIVLTLLCTIFQHYCSAHGLSNAGLGPWL